MQSIYRPDAASHPSPAELADWLGGELIDAQHAPESLTGLSPLDKASPSEISFVTDKKYLKKAAQSEAGFVITPRGSELPGRARLEVDHVWTAVAALMARLYPDPVPEPGVHPTATLGKDVRLGEGVSIGPYSVIGDRTQIDDGVAIGPHCSVDADCTIGAGSKLNARITLQGRVLLGRNVVIHPGVTIGADGFKYESGSMGILKIPQVGRVVIEDEVEIGANTTIDRAFIHETRIGYGTKIDNLVQIGHNCTVGKFCILCGCAGLAGSVTLGDGCIVGGAAKFRDNITLGPGCQIAGGAGVTKDHPAGSTIAGFPAHAARDWLRVSAIIPKLPNKMKEISRRLAALEAAISEVEEPAQR